MCPIDGGTPLPELAAKHRTDKLRHGYIPRYERHFGPLRALPVRLLEIGVAKGRSLFMWRDYFPAAHITGLDIVDLTALATPRIRIYHGDQSNAELLQRVVAESGGIDIVIDDGGHVNRDVIASFHTLFPLLSQGGLYVIEDIHTSYWSAYGGEFRDLNTGRTTASFVKGLIDGLNCHWIPGRTPTDRDLGIDGVYCYPKLVFISKGDNPQLQRPSELRMMQASLDEAQAATVRAAARP